MERHRCKLCSKLFTNGRALGGHMRSHLSILTIPCKKKTNDQLISDRTDSDSSSSFNPNPDTTLNNACRHVEGLLHADHPVLLQDIESETESTQNPNRRRSKRTSRGKMTTCGSHRLLRGVGKPEKWLKRMDRQQQRVRVKSESVTELTESALVSSVSDACQDEEVALCLMMLSRDVWEKRVVTSEDTNSVDSAELGNLTRLATQFPQKLIKSEKTRTNRRSSVEMKCNKIYECPFCGKVFGSGQALGGHKRSHLLRSSSTKVESNKNDNNIHNVFSNNVGEDDKTIGDASSFILDLNLPAPLEDGEDIS